MNPSGNIVHVVLTQWRADAPGEARAERREIVGRRDRLMECAWTVDAATRHVLAVVLGERVDLVPDVGLRPHWRDDILAEAVPLWARTTRRSRFEARGGAERS